MMFSGQQWLGETMLFQLYPNGVCLGGHHSSQLPTSMSADSSSLWWAHFLWLTATILAIADSWWAERSLLEYLRSADPTGMYARQDYSCLGIGPETTWILWLISFPGKEAVKQRVSCCLGWVRSSLILRGLGLAYTGMPVWPFDRREERVWRVIRWRKETLVEKLA